MKDSFINITNLDILLKRSSVNVTPLNIPISSTLQSILKEFKERDYQGLVVGGSVRDALIGYPSKDVDIEVYGITLNNLLEILNRHGKAHLEGKSFGVIKFRDEEGNDYDFSVPRRDSRVENDPQSNAKGRGIKVEIDIRMHPAEASLRRDYTINSMAYDPLSGEFHDYHGGASDLKAGILRATDYNTFLDDPLRTLRGLQFCGRFNLTAEPNTVELCKRLKSTQLQRDRVRDEWMKFFGKSKTPSKGFQFLIDTEWIDNYPELKGMINVPQDPEHHPEGTLDRHVSHVLDAAAKIAETKKMPENERVILIASAMCHDLGKATTTDTTGERITSYGHHKESGVLAKSFLNSIGISSEVSKIVIPLVEEHMSPVFFDPTSKKSTIMHLAEKLNHATIEQLENLILADTGGRPPKSPELSEGSRLMIDLAKEKGVYSGKAQNLISGKDLLAISPTIKGNENLGEILKEVRNKQLRGDIRNKEEALSYANRLLQRYFGLIDGNDVVESMGGQKGPIIREILEASWNAQINGEFQNKEEATYWLYNYIENMHHPVEEDDTEKETLNPD